MRIEQTSCTDEATKIITQEGIWDDCSCDGNCSRDEFSYADCDKVEGTVFMVCYENNKAVGFWIFIPIAGKWDMHIAFIDGYRSDYTIYATKFAINLLPNDLPVTIEVPEYNKKAIRHAHRFGFRDVKRQLASWKKNGISPMIRYMTLGAI